MQVHELAQRFFPLKGLKADKLNDLAKSVKSFRLSKGGLVFDFGDTSPYTYYLLQGELQLTTRDGNRISIKSSDDQAAYPVGNLLPRQLRARIRSDSAKLIRIRRRDLDRLTNGAMSSPNETGMSIRDLSGIPQDMLNLLDIPLLRRLPRANARRLFQHAEPVTYQKGDVVIREGEPGEYFYIIRQGSCRVSRRSDGRDIQLNLLTANDSFGEGALLTGQPRTATVTMDSDGELIRLKKSLFLSELVKPLLRHVPADKATRLAQAGKARIIDTRSEQKFAIGHLPEARSIPSYMLYLKRESLNRQRHYIIHSDSGRQSRAAAFVLLQRGLKVSILGKAEHLSTESVINALIRSSMSTSLCA